MQPFHDNTIVYIDIAASQPFSLWTIKKRMGRLNLKLITLFYFNIYQFLNIPSYFTSPSIDFSPSVCSIFFSRQLNCSIPVSEKKIKKFNRWGAITFLERT